ncbi:hypothetical protein KP509_22G079300 [Ceratopteris richardii]|nr:hypothetical protein KP509_22G079300 [Ceratopteris richardii]
MQTFAEAWVDHDTTYTTRVDEVGGINPVWRDCFLMPIPLKKPGIKLAIDVFTMSCTGTKPVGRTLVDVMHILEPTTAPGISKHGDAYYANYPLRAPTGEMQGRLYICFWPENRVKADEKKQRRPCGNPYIFTKRAFRANGLGDFVSSVSELLCSPSSAAHRYDTERLLPQPIRPPNMKTSELAESV